MEECEEWTIGKNATPDSYRGDNVIIRQWKTSDFRLPTPDSRLLTSDSRLPTLLSPFFNIQQNFP
jgi:Ni/Co efflux regulator RcnB